jgi:hypothetical protein
LVGELLDFISDHFSPAWGTAAAVLAAAYVAMLGFARLFEIWKSFRTRRAILEEEKLIAEIQKIRYEIEALRKHNDLPELALPMDSAKGQPRAAGRHGFALPELPAFSFTPALSLFALRLRRPASGLPRALWALKLLALDAILFCIGMVILVSVLPGKGEHVVGPVFLSVAMLVAACLIVSCLVNLARALLAHYSRSASAPA